MKKGLVINCFPFISTFIKKELDIIGTEYKLVTHSFNPSKKILVPFSFLHQFYFLLKHIFQAKIIICRFVGYHSLLPAILGRITGKPVMFILGGTECHYFPSYNYGAFTNKLYAVFTRLSFRFATHLVPVHESLILSDYTYDDSGAPKQGCKYFCPWIKTPFTPIYNGYDSTKFYNTGKKKKENSFITIASNFDGSEFYRKGIDLVFEVAKKFHEATFTIIGNTSSTFENIPSNIKIIPFIPNEQLKDFFSEHEFYLQLSLAEGFPNALCEAMLCECIPIGSDVFGIPHIIGDSGFVLKKRNMDELEDLINKALKSEKEFLSSAASNRIKVNFPYQRKEKELLNLIESLIKDK